ncbi:MAG: hypothetical protein L0G19_07875 [Micrococcales bacterium]|nr:hypothetical protein [Micrococcales bacterium]
MAAASIASALELPRSSV